MYSLIIYFQKRKITAHFYFCTVSVSKPKPGVCVSNCEFCHYTALHLIFPVLLRVQALPTVCVTLSEDFDL